jgi:hypothetical protein
LVWQQPPEGHLPREQDASGFFTLALNVESSFLGSVAPHSGQGGAGSEYRS